LVNDKFQAKNRRRARQAVPLQDVGVRYWAFRFRADKDVCLGGEIKKQKANR
jgi:hypothetical protein